MPTELFWFLIGDMVGIATVAIAIWGR